MTTARSPARKIYAQAVRIAAEMKRMVRKEGQDSVKVAVAMDDKIFSIHMTWETLEGMTEEELVPLICAGMREEPVPEPRDEWKFPQFAPTAKEKGKPN